MGDVGFWIVLLLLLKARSSSTPRKGPPPGGWPPGEDNLGVHPLPPNPLKK